MYATDTRQKKTSEGLPVTPGHPLPVTDSAAVNVCTCHHA